METDMTLTVLVIGATGKTGRRLVPLLADRGVSVRAASRQPGAGRTLFDWQRSETHAPALDGANAVYLIAPEMMEDPTALTGPFLDRVRQAGVERIVALSSLGVESPVEPAASGRLRLERQVMGSGIAWTILRASGFHQNFSEGFLLPPIVQADMVATATGDGKAAFVDAGDIAAVAAAALTEDGHEGAVYAVTGPQALSFTEATAIIGSVVGRTIAHRAVGSAEFLEMLRGAGVPADYAMMLVRDQEGIREGRGAFIADTVAELTGRPATSFEDYATRTAAAWARPRPIQAA
jgi:uncharacterized protein YbjT (DUF2867 family)